MGEITSHYGVLEITRSLLEPHGYRVHQIRAEERSGSIGIVNDKKHMTSALPYDLPVSESAMRNQIRLIGMTEDSGEAWDRSRRD